MKALLYFILVVFAGHANAQDSADVMTTKIGNLSIQPIHHASLILTIPSLTIYADPVGIDYFKNEAHVRILEELTHILNLNYYIEKTSNSDSIFS